MLSAHAAFGAGIGAAVDDPWWTLLWSQISHFVLDLFPHADLAHLAKPAADGGNQRIRSDNYPWWVPYVIFADLIGAIWVIVWAAHIMPSRAVSIVVGGVSGMSLDIVQYAPKLGPWIEERWWFFPWKWAHTPGNLHFPLEYWQRRHGFHFQLLALVGSIYWIHTMAR